MSKKYLYILFIIFFGCTNPSMENGFRNLNQSLSELVAAFDAVNIPQITSDIEQMIKDLESIANGIQDYQDAVDEYNNHIAFYNEAILDYNDAMLEYEEARLANQEFLDQIENVMNNMIESLKGLQRLHEEGNEWAGIFLQIANIRLGLQDILATMKTKATKAQVQELLIQIEEMGEKIDQLVAIADYDYDGIVNALDLCPDTPLTKINMVNSSGCAPGETPISETTTSTTGD